MSQLWPRLSKPYALEIYDDIAGSRHSRPEPSSNHPHQTFAATGGARVTPPEVSDLRVRITLVAEQCGFPNNAVANQRIAFDRSASEVLFERMSITAFEAAQPGVWTFLATVAMPDVTKWRFGTGNLERWVASDLTRHMFSRLWWQALTFGVPRADGSYDFQLLRNLSESDLNQLTERRSIAGNQRVARTIAAELICDAGRSRTKIRDVSRGIRRLTPFVDFSAVTDEELSRTVRSILNDPGDHMR